MTLPLVWDVDPVILPIVGPFAIRWYSLLFLGGFLFGHAAFASFLRAAGKPEELRDSLLYYVVFGTIIGARLGHCLFYDPIGYLSNPLTILQTWEGGLASHGGFLGVMIALYLFSRKHKETPFFWLADRVAIVAIFAGGLIRIGNLFNSEIIGKPTDVAWAMVFPKIDMIPRHPTQLYEAAAYFFVSLVLYITYRLSDRKPLEGRLYGMVMVLGYCLRFGIEHFKENQETFENGMLFNMGQLLSVPFILFGIYLILGWHHKSPWFAWGFAKSDSFKSGSVNKSSSKGKKKANPQQT